MPPRKPKNPLKGWVCVTYRAGHNVPAVMGRAEEIEVLGRRAILVTRPEPLGPGNAGKTVVVMADDIVAIAASTKAEALEEVRSLRSAVANLKRIDALCADVQQKHGEQRETTDSLRHAGEALRRESEGRGPPPATWGSRPKGGEEDYKRMADEAIAAATQRAKSEAQFERQRPPAPYIAEMIAAEGAEDKRLRSEATARALREEEAAADAAYADLQSLKTEAAPAPAPKEVFALTVANPFAGYSVAVGPTVGVACIHDEVWVSPSLLSPAALEKVRREMAAMYQVPYALLWGQDPPPEEGAAKGSGEAGKAGPERGPRPWANLTTSLPAGGSWRDWAPQPNPTISNWEEAQRYMGQPAPDDTYIKRDRVDHLRDEHGRPTHLSATAEPLPAPGHAHIPHFSDAHGVGRIRSPRAADVPSNALCTQVMSGTFDKLFGQFVADLRGALEESLPTGEPSPTGRLTSTGRFPSLFNERYLGALGPCREEYALLESTPPQEGPSPFAVPPFAEGSPPQSVDEINDLVEVEADPALADAPTGEQEQASPYVDDPLLPAYADEPLPPGSTEPTLAPSGLWDIRACLVGSRLLDCDEAGWSRTEKRRLRAWRRLVRHHAYELGWAACKLDGVRALRAMAEVLEAVLPKDADAWCLQVTQLMRASEGTSFGTWTAYMAGAEAARDATCASSSARRAAVEAAHAGQHLAAARAAAQQRRRFESEYALDRAAVCMSGALELLLREKAGERPLDCFLAAWEKG